MEKLTHEQLQKALWATSGNEDEEQSEKRQKLTDELRTAYELTFNNAIS